MTYRTVADNYLYIGTDEQDDLPSGVFTVRELKNGSVYGIPAGTLLPTAWAERLRNTRDRALDDAMDAGDRFIRYDELPWNPKDAEVGQEPVSVQGREAHMRIIPDGSLMFFGGHLRMTPIAAADTPQNRYARLRALVPAKQPDAEGAATSPWSAPLVEAVQRDHHAHTAPHLPRARVPFDGSVLQYLTAHPEDVYKQLSMDWQRKAEFYKTASLVFMGSAVLSAGCLFSKIVGWW